MHTAASVSTGTPPGQGQRNSSASTGASPTGAVHILARLPDLRPSQPRSTEPRRVEAASLTAPAFTPRAASAQPNIPAEAFAEARSEFFDPHELPLLDRVLDDGRLWFSKHGKMALVIVALVASHGALLFWRQPPAAERVEQEYPSYAETAESPRGMPEQLNPVPLEPEPVAPQSLAPELASTSSFGEPHLALPQPHPDPISVAAPPYPTLPEDPADQPKLAAVMKRAAEQPQVAEERRSMPAVAPAAEKKPPLPEAKDVPPWESWSDEPSSPATVSPATEAAAAAATAAPVLTAPVLSGPGSSPAISRLPDATRTASLPADRSPSPAVVGSQPRAVGRLKGTIDKPSGHIGSERTQRKLY